VSDEHERIEPRYLTAPEAAVILGVTPWRLRRLPDLLYCRVTARTHRWDRKDLMRYLPVLRYRQRSKPRRLPTDTEEMATLIIKTLAAHPSDGFVYFMRCREIVKIGFSRQPADRRERLASIIPFELELIGSVPGSWQAEQDLHAAFAERRFGHLREWFTHCPVLLAAIQEVIAFHAQEHGHA
jgi:hypothetical protein